MAFSNRFGSLEGVSGHLDWGSWKEFSLTASGKPRVRAGQLLGALRWGWKRGKAGLCQNPGGKCDSCAVTGGEEPQSLSQAAFKEKHKDKKGKILAGAG